MIYWHFEQPIHPVLEIVRIIAFSLTWRAWNCLKVSSAYLMNGDFVHKIP